MMLSIFPHINFPSVYLLDEVSDQIFFLLYCMFSSVNFKSFMHISDISPVKDMFCKYIFLVCDSSFHSLNSVLSKRKEGRKEVRDGGREEREKKRERKKESNLSLFPPFMDCAFGFVS